MRKSFGVLKWFPSTDAEDAQRTGQEPEMETEISVIFSTQMNSSVVLCYWRDAEYCCHFLPFC